MKPKIAFLCSLSTQTATWQPNHEIFTSIIKALLKAITNTLFFWDQLWGWTDFFLNLGWEVFPTRETTLVVTGWTLLYAYFPSWEKGENCLLLSCNLCIIDKNGLVINFFFYKKWKKIIHISSQVASNEIKAFFANLCPNSHHWGAKLDWKTKN